MSDLKPRRCDEHDFQCYKCGVAAEAGVNIGVNTRAEPECFGCGQLALEWIRNMMERTNSTHRGDGVVVWTFSDTEYKAAKALLEASKEKP